jgi:tetratricopeptide (TPR) repeat protein
MHVVSLHVPAPPTRQRIVSPERALADAARALGASFRAITLDSWKEAEDVWTDLGGGEGVTVILLSGHGTRKARGRESTPRNLLLTSDTDPCDIFDTSVDLDMLVRALPPRPGGYLVAVDACEVDVNTSLGPGSSVAVLVASPGREAEAGGDGPILSLALARELADGRRTGRSLRSVVDATSARVQQETRGRQQPALRLLGDGRFLDVPPSALPPTQGDAHLARRLAELVGSDDLPKKVLDALDEVVQAAHGDAGLVDLALSLQARRLFPQPTREAANELKEVLERSKAAPPSVRAAALHWLGWAQVQLGDPLAALGHLQDAVGLAERQGDTALASQIRNTLATAAREIKAFPMADGHYETSFRLKEGIGDAKGMEMTRSARGWLLCAQGEFEEAGKLFAEGVETCLAALRAGTTPYDAQARLAAMESLFFHVVGRCVTLLLVGADPNAFQRLKANIQPWIQVYRPFHGWGGIGPMEESLVLLCLGAKDRAPQRPNADHATTAHWYQSWWSSIRAAHTEGVDGLKDVEARLGDDPPRGEQLPARMKQLAGLHLLCRDLVGEAPTALRDRFIDRLRQHDHLTGIPRPDAPPWVSTARALTLNTEGWCTWGPLGGQLAEITRPNALITPTAPEQYLQLLAWATLLVLALHGRQTWHQVTEHLAALGKDGFSLTLGSAIQACRRIARDVPQAGNSPVATLAAAWKTQDCPKHHVSMNWDDIAAERNRIAHREQQTVEAANHLLARQSGLIRELSRLLGESDVVVSPGQPVSDPNLCTVKLSTSLGGRGPTLDCGPLLLCAAVDHEAFYVPHHLDRSLLCGPAEGTAVYVRYAAAPTLAPADANLRWPAPDAALSRS